MPLYCRFNPPSAKVFPSAGLILITVSATSPLRFAKFLEAILPRLPARFPWIRFVGDSPALRCVVVGRRLRQ